MASGGVCMMNTKWRDEHPERFINSLSSFLSAASYRLNILPIAPDFILNHGGISIAFIFITDWKSPESIAATFSRIEKMKTKFRHFYVIATISTDEENRSFVDCYFKSGLAIGSPTFIPVRHPYMGFEKMLKLALVRAECKRHDAVAKINKESVQSVEACSAVLTSIPGVETHDAHMLMQGIGSIAAISRASKEEILESTDLSAHTAEKIVKFFNDPAYYTRPKMN